MRIKITLQFFKLLQVRVYGDPATSHKRKILGQCESIGTRACYDEGKRCVETIFVDYMRTKSVDIKVIRIFNTYGPNMQPDDGRVFQILLLKF